jgi:hypothetical protein
MTPTIFFPSTFVQSTSSSGTRTMLPSFKLEVGNFVSAFFVSASAFFLRFAVAFARRELSLETLCDVPH